MNKVYPSAAAGARRHRARRAVARRGRLRPVRHSRGADRRAARHEGEEPDRDLEQRRCRRLRSRPVARDAPDQEDDLELRRREQGVRAPVPGRRARARVHAAGHAGREAARRRRRHSGLLHAHRRGHAGGRRQGNARVRRPRLRDGARADARGVAGQGLEGRQERQPDLPPHRAQLQPGRARWPARSPWWKSSRSSRPARFDPDAVHLPGIYVHRIVLNANPEKRIEKRTITERMPAKEGI